MSAEPGRSGLLEGIALLVGFQFAGEVIVRVFRFPVPAPVLGMALLFLWLLWLGRVPHGLQIASHGLLGNLSLLFVPASVAAFLDLDAISDEAFPIVVAVVASTFLAMGCSAAAFAALERHGRKPT